MTEGGNDGGREWRVGGNDGRWEWRVGGNDGGTGTTDWWEWQVGGDGPALPAHGYRMWASPSVFVANQFVIPAKAGI